MYKMIFLKLFLIALNWVIAEVPSGSIWAKSSIWVRRTVHLGPPGGPSVSAGRSIWVRRSVHLGPSGSIWVHPGRLFANAHPNHSLQSRSVLTSLHFMFLPLKLRGNLNQRQRSRQNNQSFSKKYRRSLALIPNLEDIIAKAVTS